MADIQVLANPITECVKLLKSPVSSTSSPTVMGSHVEINLAKAERAKRICPRHVRE